MRPSQSVMSDPPRVVRRGGSGGGSNLGRKPNPPREASRYSHSMVVAEIRSYLETAPRGTAKKLAEIAGMDHAGFSNRLHEQRGMRFNYEQLGAIADAIGAPPGWPLVNWKIGEAVATVMRLAGTSMSLLWAGSFMLESF